MTEATSEPPPSAQPEESPVLRLVMLLQVNDEDPDSTRRVAGEIWRLGATVTELAIQSGDPDNPTLTSLFEPLNDRERDFHHKLDTNMSDALAAASARGEVKEGIADRAADLLQEYGIGSLRDVLVAGRKHVHGIRNLGNECLKAIQSVLAYTFGSEVEWLSLPTIADAARWCIRADQVRGWVLAKHLQHLSGFTVQQILDTPPEFRARAFSDKSQPKEEMAAEVYERAQAYAAQFWAARRRFVERQLAS